MNDCAERGNPFQDNAEGLYEQLCARIGCGASSNTARRRLGEASEFVGIPMRRVHGYFNRLLTLQLAIQIRDDLPHFIVAEDLLFDQPMGMQNGAVIASPKGLANLAQR